MWFKLANLLSWGGGWEEELLKAQEDTNRLGLGELSI
jgi:hypothetical protein